MAECYPINKLVSIRSYIALHYLYHYSYYLYSVSLPNKNGVPQFDLTVSEEVPSVGLETKSFTATQLAIRKVIANVFQYYDIPLEINEKIYSIFKNKLHRMGRAAAVRSGGKKEKLVKEWRDSVWEFIVDASEAKRQFLIKKRKVEEQLKYKSAKRQQLEMAVNTLQRDIAALKEVNGIAKGSQRRKRQWTSYSRQHKRVIKNQTKVQLSQAISLCNTAPLKVESIQLSNQETGEVEVLDIDKGTFSTLKSAVPEPVVEGDEKALLALYIKDQFNISDRAYLAMTKLSADLPRKYQLKNLAGDLDAKFELKATPGGTTGVQQSLLHRLTLRLEQLKKSDLLPSSNRLRIRLSGDGTYIAKNLHVINFTFTLIEETRGTSTATENHSLAILNIPEKYECLKIGLSDIISEAKGLMSIEFNSTIYDIEYFLSGDWKFLG